MGDYSTKIIKLDSQLSEQMEWTQPGGPGYKILTQASHFYYFQGYGTFKIEQKAGSATVEYPFNKHIQLFYIQNIMTSQICEKYSNI